MTSTFDDILPIISAILSEQAANLEKLGAIIINRDLYGRVRLVVNEKIRNDTDATVALDSIARALYERLGKHSFPSEHMLIFETDIQTVVQGAPHFLLDGFDKVTVVDRLTTETDWGSIKPVATGVPRIVFFSIKGGVGRSTALAVSAWDQAQQGKRVLVLDLDLESPGLSNALLPDDRRPKFGIADWLVEDLVNNSASVFSNMYATSNLSHDGEIYVVPAHGSNPGEYIAKLGRAWMSKVSADGTHEPWSKRLHRLLNDLEQHLQPDVILIDSRSGIDEVASACITDIGASGILLFAIDGEQTWSGYRILFHHWLRAGAALKIRERLQVVGAMIPELNGPEYFAGLREQSWNTFSDALYDEIPAGETTEERFSFDESDKTAPHYPWEIKWHRGFAALRSVHTRFQSIDQNEITAVFGSLIDGINTITDSKEREKNE